jgi:DNA mismatch endonuclease (patch repair protein)
MTSRSSNMRAIRSKGMRPELTVRRLVHGMGYRYRLHRSDLPGTPDLVFPSRRKIILVHGCFWHAHRCQCAHIPRSNVDYWGPKLRRNVARDAKALKELAGDGWSCLVIWECEIKASEAQVRTRAGKFLRGAMRSQKSLRASRP